jgi:hypothetical protein
MRTPHTCDGPWYLDSTSVIECITKAREACPHGHSRWLEVTLPPVPERKVAAAWQHERHAVRLLCAVPGCEHLVPASCLHCEEHKGTREACRWCKIRQDGHPCVQHGGPPRTTKNGARDRRRVLTGVAR